MAAWPIIGYLICWLIEGDLVCKGRAIKQNKFVWLFSGFYLLYLIRYLFSGDYDMGWHIMQVKLSLFLFPLLLVSEGVKNIKEQKMFIYTFIAGCVVNGLICIGYAIWNLAVNNVFVFQYIQFSILLHPSYYSMYIDVVMLLVFYLFTNSTVVLNKSERIFLLGATFFLLFILVLLQSKMGMFISAALIVVLLTRYALKRGYKTVMGLLAVGLVVYFVTFHFLIGQNSRVAGAAEVITSNKISASSTESTQVRYYVWTAAMEVIKRAPVFGVGVGNESPVLVDQYEKDGYTGAAKEKLNAHDQYIQTTVSTGIVGLLLLLAGFLFSFITAVKERRFVYGTFLVIVALNFLVEAMFELQSGTIFFGLFNSLLMFNFVI